MTPTASNCAIVPSFDWFSGALIYGVSYSRSITGMKPVTNACASEHVSPLGPRSLTVIAYAAVTSPSRFVFDISFRYQKS